MNRDYELTQRYGLDSPTGGFFISSNKIGAAMGGRGSASSASVYSYGGVTFLLTEKQAGELEYIDTEMLKLERLK